MDADNGGVLFVTWLVGVLIGVILIVGLDFSGAGGWKQDPKIERCAVVSLNFNGEAKQSGYKFKIYTSHLGDLCQKVVQ